MPCNSDYMHPTELEVEISRVYQLLDELDGKAIDPDSWDGFDPRVYNEKTSKEHRDQLADSLCQKVKQLKDITRYSLEMQIWWRDHQEVDRQRQLQEEALKRLHGIRNTALNKLSPEEREALELD